MSDKELIKQEIEKRLSLLWDLIPEGEKVLQDDFTKEDANNLGKYTELESLLKFIDSLPEEHNEDLEEELNRWQIYHDYPEEYLDLLNFARHFAEWQKQQIKKALQTEYEKGRFDMREEMMKDAVDATIFSELKGSNGSVFQAKSDRFKMNDVKISDRIKVIPIKIEQQ